MEDALCNKLLNYYYYSKYSKVCLQDALCKELLTELYYSRYSKMCLQWKLKELER
jgi:bacterioferritin (cytochrome b1)